MRESEFEEEMEPVRIVIRPRRRSLFRFVPFVILGYFLLCLPLSSTTPYTCAFCRQDRSDQWLLGLRWFDFQDSECSRWYLQNVERSHEHVWVRKTKCRRIGLPGFSRGYACYIGAPVTNLSPSLQIRIYEHFGDRSQAKPLFLSLGRTDHNAFRYWNALMGWVETDFSGSWPDWWKAHQSDPEN